MTNLDRNGHYPISDVSPFNENFKEDRFELLWKEHFSTFPEFYNMDWKQRDFFKRVARETFMEAVIGLNVQEIVDRAYEDGFSDGKDKAIEEVSEKFNDVTQGLVAEVNRQVDDSYSSLKYILSKMA